MTATVAGLLAEIADVGVDARRGGYTRPVYSHAERELREWFTANAERRSLSVDTDRNGILWAWDGESADGAVVTGSHLDSVPGGGAFDGPLGIASALVALDLLRERGIGGRPRAIAVFPEEEGSRFGVPCLGSRLLTGALEPESVLGLTDADGTTFADAAIRNGLDPRHLGADRDALGRMHAFVELHVEQGRGLVDLGRSVAIGTSILGHGRWRVTVTGEGNHAGTTRMADRRDPMVAAATIVLEVQRLARAHPEARATVGRVVPVPGGTNVIASRVDLWVDIRHPDDVVTAALIAVLREAAEARADEEGCRVVLVEESYSPKVGFDSGLRDRLSAVLPDAPLLATGAGHDAGVLGSHVPTGMLFVRNPTGVSHSEHEHVEEVDAEVGAVALADCLQALATG